MKKSTRDHHMKVGMVSAPLFPSDPAALLFWGSAPAPRRQEELRTPAAGPCWLQGQRVPGAGATCLHQNPGSIHHLHPGDTAKVTREGPWAHLHSVQPQGSSPDLLQSSPVFIP